MKENIKKKNAPGKREILSKGLTPELSPLRKIIRIILKVDDVRTSTNVSENKKANDDA